MLNALNQTIKACETKVSPRSYTVGAIGNVGAFNNLIKARDEAATKRQEIAKQIEDATEREQARQVLLTEEAAAERVKEAESQWLVGALIGVGGAICIVATAGLATPFVVAGVAAGGCTIIYGCAEMSEAENSKKLGLAGDPYTVAFNPVRDTIFMGNQQAYDTFGRISMISSSVVSLGAGGYQAFASGGVKATVAFSGKVAVSGLVGTGSGAGAKALGAPDGVAVWIGAGAATVTGIGLNKANTHLGCEGTGGGKPIENGPYIKDGKPNGRPSLSGDKKLQFETDVYKNSVDPDGVLRDPNTGTTIDWKPGQPRKGVVDFGHKAGNSYNDMFQKYKNGQITLKELKKFQFDAKNYRLEAPSANRSHLYE